MLFCPLATPPAYLDYAVSVTHRLLTSSTSACRYWTMYKLPMFGCTDPSQVLTEINNCTKSFPDAYIRLVAFDQVCNPALQTTH